MVVVKDLVVYILIGLFLSVTSLTTNAQIVTVENHSFLGATHFIDARQDTALTARARALREGYFETAGGDAVTFSRWYSTEFREIQISYLTQINHTFGFIWGFGTGETAEKYTIAPSVRLGFVYSSEYSKNNRFSVTASTYLGGELNEHSCVADYGDIGGIREVNCRLAATTLEPEETLNYLERGTPESTIRINLVHQF